MYKYIDKEHIYSYPADKHTSFYIEGRNDYYTIIDVVSIGGDMYALLESNKYGEEDVVIAYLGRGQFKSAYLLQRYDRNGIDVNLNAPANNVIFLWQRNLKIEVVYDSLKDVLIEDGADPNDIIEWTDEEINDHYFKNGGIVR